MLNTRQTLDYTLACTHFTLSIPASAFRFSLEIKRLRKKSYTKHTTPEAETAGPHKKRATWSCAFDVQLK